MTTQNIPQFNGNFRIVHFEGKFYCMHGKRDLHKSNGDIAAYRSLTSAMKFMVARDIHPISQA